MYMFRCPKSPRRLGDFEQRSTVNISECNSQLELCNVCCSYMVLTNPHMKPRIQFIIMKIFMKIVKICPKSPWFTIHQELGIKSSCCALGENQINTKDPAGWPQHPLLLPWDFALKFSLKLGAVQATYPKSMDMWPTLHEGIGCRTTPHRGQFPTE